MSSLIKKIRKWLTPDDRPLSETEAGHTKLPEAEREAMALTPREEAELKEDTEAAESEGMTPPDVETPEVPSEHGGPKRAFQNEGTV
jgi:hypothetical protein